jgi:hypothetical protein
MPRFWWEFSPSSRPANCILQGMVSSIPDTHTFLIAFSKQVSNVQLCRSAIFAVSDLKNAGCANVGIGG